ncbi:glycosyltransferase [Shewanella frigidimarina]|uniref:glycosyltransferase n=1 Tax=Shewanella frigidimarina TaxID=56812 RepID=UPI003FA0F26F
MYPVLLKLWSNTHHLQQAYAGFSILHYCKKINLSQVFVKPSLELKNAFQQQHLSNHYQSCFIAEVGGLTIVFDLHDSFEINPYLINKCDFYFKRSYSSKHIVESKLEGKCLPYGPFYEVYSNFFDPFLLSRGLNINLEWKRRIRSMMRAFPILDDITSISRENKLSENNRVMSSNRKIIFSVNMHDPHDCNDRSENNVEHRVQLIYQRAELVRKLRKAFPNNYLGGVKDNAVARKYAPDCILQDSEFFNKKNYLTNLKKCSIGISTPGLFNSVGGKFGEYLALGKAVVTYPLDYYQGESLSSPNNYLLASSVEHVIEKCDLLLNDSQLVSSMSENNINYYQKCLRPDIKIESLLSKIL